MIDKTRILARCASSEDKILISHCLDKLCAAEQKPAFTHFLNPRQQTLVEELLRNAGAQPVFDGGYDGAERAAVFFLPEFIACKDIRSQEWFPITALRCDVRGKGVPGHRDYLGAVVNMGIRREMIGDILPDGSGCVIAAAEEVAAFIAENLTRIGGFAVDTHIVALYELIPVEEEKKILRDTVAAPRLDAMVGAAFGMSREKAVRLIEGGLVQLSHRLCVKPSVHVSAGDVISARGQGRAEVAEIGLSTKKGRLPVVFRR